MIRPVVPHTLVLALLLAGCGAHRGDVGRWPSPGPGGAPRGGIPGRLFISPMGEPFRSDRDGDPEAAWFAGADADHDGRVSLAEFQADARRWFAVADRHHEGEIDPDDIDFYENELVPEIRVADAPRASGGIRNGGGGRSPTGGRGGMGGRGGGMGGGQRGGHQGTGGESSQPSATRPVRQGAGRYSYLDLPEPLTAADANLNRGIDAGEMTRAAADRFAQLDRNGDGYLDRRELPRVDTRSNGPTPRPADQRRPPRPPEGQEEDE